MVRKNAKIFLPSSILLFLILLFIKPKLPSPSHIDNSILEKYPQQEKIEIPEIQTKYRDFTYQIDPLYSYEIYGLVVSEYTSHNWMDVTHKKDPANTRDLCLVWGDNIKTDAYRKVKYSHGEFTCYYSYNKAIEPPFNGQLLSNNHLIPENEEVEKKIASIKVGDQVKIQGYLVNYKITDENKNQSAYRNTSITREDTRNGACEIIYVKDIEIIKRGNYAYYLLKDFLKFSIVIFLGYSIVKFFSSNINASKKYIKTKRL